MRRGHHDQNHQTKWMNEMWSQWPKSPKIDRKDKIRSQWLKPNWYDNDWSIQVRSHKLKLIRWWPIDISVIPTRTENKLIGRWLIDIGAIPKTQTQIDKTITDRYRCGPNSNSYRQYEWLIDIGMTPNIEPTRWMTDRYRCSPNTNR